MTSTETHEWPVEWRTAIHEAGHCVAWDRLGFQVLGATIAPTTETLGSCSFQLGHNTRRRGRRAAAGWVAGTLAQVQLCGGDLLDTADVYAEYDFQRADEACQGLYPDEGARVIQHAIDLVENNLDAITALAHELFWHTTLNEPQLTQLLRDHPAADRTARTPR